MTLFGLSIVEVTTIVGVLGGLLFALMKFHHVFSKLEESLQELKDAVNRLNSHEIRIARLEEQNKTIFKNMGGRNEYKHD